MYAAVKTLIDEVLMGPALAPFTTGAIIILLAGTVLAILSGSSEAEEDT